MTPAAYGWSGGVLMAVAMTYLWAWVGHHYFDRLDAWWGRHWANGATSLLIVAVACLLTIAIIMGSAAGAYNLAEHFA